MQIKTKLKYLYTTGKMTRIQTLTTPKAFEGLEQQKILLLKKHRGTLKEYYCAPAPKKGNFKKATYCIIPTMTF